MNPVEGAAAAEFDRWAESGRAESMARGHREATGQLLDLWSLTARDRVLDVGCGNGWAVNWMRERGAGSGVGIDISPAMITRANTLNHDSAWQYVVGSGERIPFEDQSFSNLLCVESLYYYADPSRALQEFFRVAQPGAKLALMMDLYADNPVACVWRDALDVAVHVLGELEYVRLVEEAGWCDVRALRLYQSSPTQTSHENFKPSRYWPSYELYQGYLAAGSLGIIATRPDPR